MTYTLFENRDVRCAADVGRMAELGRFATEIVVYGTAVQEMDGRIFYRATEHEEKLYQHIQLQRVQEEYYTPIIMQIIEKCKAFIVMNCMKHMLWTENMRYCDI